MKNLLFALFIFSLFICCSKGDEENKPVTPVIEKPVVEPEQLEPLKVFPQNINFTDCIKPNHKSQEDLNADVISYYHYWQNKYVKPSNGRTPGGGYYVAMKGTGGDGNEITTSEAHGYGMIIFALMAGADKNAKKYYDGMYNMFDKHRSTANKYCMSWLIHKTEKKAYDEGSATDGDLDIAYSLLLADRQWSSAGRMKYLDYAREMIDNGIKKSCVHPVSKRVMEGDYDRNAYSTRSSDWMPDHFHCFLQITDELLWKATADTVYSLIEQVTRKYTATNGLMPDFVAEKDPEPAPEYYLNEYKETDEYNWNACRYPMRITTDFAHFNTPAAKAAMVRTNAFIRAKTDGDPTLIKAGYYLNGEPMVDYSDASFTAPFITSCIVDPEAQNYLNMGWELLAHAKGQYYDDTLTLLNLLLISGNWWNPVAP